MGRPLKPLFPLAAALILAGAAQLWSAPQAAAFGACQAFVDRGAPRVIPARYDGAVPAETLAVTYVVHSTFLIQTPEGASVATDYSGSHGGGPPPQAVTMNNAHETHFTLFPDAAIEHVLKGWPTDGAERAEHRVALSDLQIRNVPTDVIGYSGLRRVNGNSIFVFELGDLCVGHLGHLHHVPTPAQFAEIGFLDVVMAPVDGGLTLSHEEMALVLDRLEARLVLPMHYFGPVTLQRFLTALGGAFEVKIAESPTLMISKATLPERPTMIVLPPLFSESFE